MSQYSGVLFFLLLVVGFGVKPVGACDEAASFWSTMAEGRITFRSDEKEVTHHLAVKFAVTPSQRAVGFQHICPKWMKAWGMLFVFPTSQWSTFHMRNVKEDLDIAFIADDGRILEIKRMSQEIDSSGEASYRAVQPYRYALEVIAGRLSALGLDEGRWWLVLDPAWL